MKTRRLVDRLQGRIIYIPEPGESIVGTLDQQRGPEYNIHSIPLQKTFPYPFQERYGWEGHWPGSAAPHDFCSNLALPDGALCHCGSGHQYCVCHKAIDNDGQHRNMNSIYRAFGA